jgi:hypothetical protein
MGLNFYYFKTEGLIEKHTVGIWKLGTISAVDKGRGKIRVLSSRQSPAGP